jgi:hypothetical protein
MDQKNQNICGNWFLKIKIFAEIDKKSKYLRKLITKPLQVGLRRQLQVDFSAGPISNEFRDKISGRDFFGRRKGFEKIGPLQGPSQTQDFVRVDRFILEPNIMPYLQT